jgi:hypothetical protein
MKPEKIRALSDCSQYHVERTVRASDDINQLTGQECYTSARLNPRPRFRSPPRVPFSILLHFFHLIAFFIAPTGDTGNSLVIAARDLRLILARNIDIERDGAKFRHVIRKLLVL